MPEVEKFKFSHREVLEALLKKQGIHEGLWQMVVTFGLGGVNAGENPESVSPAAVVAVQAIGIDRIEPGNPLANTAVVVDAALVNPATDSTSPAQPSSRSSGA